MAISDGVGALWTRHVEKDKLEIETKKTPIGGREMAQVQRHRRAIAAALSGLAVLAFAPAFAEDHGPSAETDLYDRPVLAIDPGMHTAAIRAQAVDAAGRYAVTGSVDRTVRIWSVADGKLLRTIWIPVGPAECRLTSTRVAISPDGSTIAAGGWTERRHGGDYPIYLFDREFGDLVRRIAAIYPKSRHSSHSRRTAATRRNAQRRQSGLRVFDRDKDWSEAFRDDQYGGDSYGAAFARDGHLATTRFGRA